MAEGDAVAFEVVAPNGRFALALIEQADGSYAIAVDDSGAAADATLTVGSVSIGLIRRKDGLYAIAVDTGAKDRRSRLVAKRPLPWSLVSIGR